MKRLISSLLVLITLFAAQPACALKTSDLVFHSADTMLLIGTLAPDAKKAYSRLPDSLENVVRKDLWDLGLDPAGLALRFRSNASAIGAAWKSLRKFNMNHMTPTGIRGLDLYVLDNDRWTTVSAARPSQNSHHTSTIVIQDMEPVMREYMLYLPLYDGVDSIMIGVDSAAVILPPALQRPVREKPIVMYGTSILQGGCATRPGMCHTSIVSRMLDREVVNLGFSGNAKLDLEIARLIADMPAPGVIVIDALPNLKTPELVERLPEFYAIIRAKHPTVPILLVESPIFPVMRFNTETMATITEKNKALLGLYRSFVEAGDDNLHYFKGEDVLGDCVEGTVDNYHLTDLGFTRFANTLAPILSTLLENK